MIADTGASDGSHRSPTPTRDQGAARSADLHRLRFALAWAAWLTLAPPVWGGQCVVLDPSIAAGTPPPPKVVPPMQFVMGPAESASLEAATMRGVKPEPEDAAMQRKRAIWATVRDRDLATFRGSMPTDPTERLALLRQTYALSSAFRASSLPIVRQVLEWDPDALSDSHLAAGAGRSPSSRRRGLRLRTPASVSPLLRFPRLNAD